MALPVAAVIRETVIYLRRHLVLEPWTTVGPQAGLVTPATHAPGGEPGAESKPQAGSEPHQESEADRDVDLEAAYRGPRRVDREP